MTPMSRRQFLALSGAAAAHAALGRTTAAEPTPMTDQSLTAGNTAFALDLYGQLRKEAGNLFVSPFSISTALAMTAAGARGTTRDEMQKALHLSENPHAAFGDLIGRLNGTGGLEKRPYQLNTANAIWAQQGYPWRTEFKNLVRKEYGSGLVETNFGQSEEARRAINTWVEKETHEKIKDLVPPGVITALTRMVLANAVYFKAAWLMPFEKGRTKDQPFTTADGAKVDVPLMAHTGTFGYGEVLTRAGDRAQIIELPYSGKDLSMLVVLPQDKLAGLEGQLSAPDLVAWAKDMRPQQVNLFLPRFKVEKAVGLKPPLVALGIKAAFDDGTADFSGMCSGDEKLYISAALHKAFVDVNEEGTEAAAATAVVIGVRSVPAKPTVFRADRPFLFLIRDNKTGAVLFLGRVTNPKG